MTTTIQINGKDVDIELTPDQIEQIKRSTIKVTDRIRSYADACHELGIEPIRLESFDFIPAPHRKSMFAFHKITTIIQALNEGWVPDWNDEDQPKYYVWYKWVGSGAGFSCHGCDFGHSVSDVGSRLHFKSKELALFFAEQFITEINEYFTL